MRTIKLSPAQNKNLTEALQAQATMQHQVQVAQAQLNSAANHRQGIFEMVCEAHGIEIKTIDPRAQIKISKDGVLTIGEVSASDRIKKDLKKSTKSNGHGKAKTDSKKH